MRTWLRPAGRTGVLARAGGRDRTGRALGLDLGLYLLCATFAGLTAAYSTLAPHRAWGSLATAGYALASVVAVAQLAVWAAARRAGRTAAPPVAGPTVRAVLAVGVWLATAIAPLIHQAMSRAGGRTDRAQEEVIVIEDGARRLLESGTPYLDRAAIAALPAPERLLGYLPYQPAMVGFGLPRALADTTAWWSDARVWFAIVTAAALGLAVLLLWRRGSTPAPGPAHTGPAHTGPAHTGPAHTGPAHTGPAHTGPAHTGPARKTGLVRALQAVAAVPVATLTLATGGDDLPVLALCLLAVALAATHRLSAAGLAVGAAAALKLVAWPVAVVLSLHALTRGRDAATRFAAAAIAPTLLTAVGPAVAHPAAMVDNILAFPLGRGVVASPAASPLPGHLIATTVPGGRAIAYALLAAAVVGIAAWLVRRPPRTAAAAAFACGVGLLAAMLLLPASRFGYLLYPLGFLVWAAALVPAPVPDSPGPIGAAEPLA